MHTQQIPLKYTIGAFLVFVGTQLLIVPLITIAWFMLIGQQFFHHELVPADPGANAWLNLFSIGCVAATLLGYYLALPKLIRQSIWGAGTFKGFTHQIKSCVIGFLTWFASYPIVIVIGQIIAILLLILFNTSPVNQVAVQQLKNTMNYPVQFFTLSLMIILIVPMIEEILFRGFLQNSIRQSYGRYKGILYSSIIFTLFHFSISQGVRNIEILSSLFILSLFLGFIYERQQSLWAPITLHATFNGMSVVMLLIET